MQRFGLFLIWVVATVFVTVLAWRVVLAADAQVSDPPARIVEAVPPTAARPSVSLPESTTTSLDLDPEAPPRSSTTVDGQTATTSPSSTTTTTISPTPSTSTPTTTSTIAIPFQTKEILTNGGRVYVSYRPGEVNLLLVQPSPGWEWELTRDHNDDIEGRFTRGDDEIRVRARWSDGEFIWSVG